MNSSDLNVVDPMLFNTTNMNLTVLPAMGREKLNGFNWSSLNFTWKAISYEGGELKIEINWAEHIEVSPLPEQDQLQV